MRARSKALAALVNSLHERGAKIALLGRGAGRYGADLRRQQRQALAVERAAQIDRGRLRAVPAHLDHRRLETRQREGKPCKPGAVPDAWKTRSQPPIWPASGVAKPTPSASAPWPGALDWCRSASPRRPAAARRDRRSGSRRRRRRRWRCGRRSGARRPRSRSSRFPSARPARRVRWKPRREYRDRGGGRNGESGSDVDGGQKTRSAGLSSTMPTIA